MQEITLETVVEKAKYLGKTIKHDELSSKYFEVIAVLTPELRRELYKADFFNKLFIYENTKLD